MRNPFFLIMIGCLCAASPAADWTVAPEGPADFSNLRAAMETAASGDTLTLADGIYRGEENRNIRVDGKAITVRGEDRSVCIIDIQGLGRGFEVWNNAELTLEHVTLRRGIASGGGAVQLSSGALIVESCLFIDNISSTVGGALHVAQGECDIRNSLFVQNLATANGGAVSTGWSAGRLNMSDCQLYDNQGQQGGALGLESYSGRVQLDRCVLAHNTAFGDGGAVYSYYTDLMLSNCEIADNEAQGDGGGLYAYRGVQDLVHCTIHNNVAAQEAGGIYTRYAEPFSLRRCAVTSNRGGGVWWYYWDPEACIVETCLFQGNENWDWYDDWENRSIRGGTALNGLPYARENVGGDPAYAFGHSTRLRGTSACLDPGPPAEPNQWPPADLEGVARLTRQNRGRDLSPDIGAYEYDAGPLLALSERILYLETEIQGPAPVATLQLRNAGGSPLEVSVSVDVPWLQVDSNQSSLASDAAYSLQVSADVSGLSRGLYLGRLTLSGAQAANTPRVLPVVLRVLGSLPVPEVYATVGAAVGEAMAGETVAVQGGPYPESVSLWRAIRLLGQDEPELGGVSIFASGATLRGFTCQGSGITLSGRENTIENNTVIGGNRGLYIQGEGGHTVTNNTVRDCLGMGIEISHAPNNILRGNRLLDNELGFNVTGDYDQDIDLSNTVDGQAIVYLVDEQDRVIFADTNPACVYLIRCTDMVVMNVTLAHQGKGLCLVDCTDVTARQVTCVGHSHNGILMERGAGNYLVDNTVRDCAQGIILVDGIDHLLSDNRLDENTLGFACTGRDREHYNHRIDTSNTQNDRPIVYLLEAQNAVVDADTQAACVYAIGCQNVTISGQDLRNNRDAVVLFDTQKTRLEDLVLADNDVGVAIRGESEDIALVGLEARNNDFGLRIDSGLRIEVRESLIQDNRIGMYFGSVIEGFVDRCHIADNGTGLENSNGEMVVQNCMITGNTEYGGIRLNSYRENLIQFCTLMGNNLRYNSPEEGGGLSGSYDDLALENCIVWGNSPGQIPAWEWIEQTVSTCDIEGGFAGKDNLDTDPLLTPDGHLRMASPCRGYGQSSHLPINDIDGEVRSARTSGGRAPAAERTRSGRGDVGADQYVDVDEDGLPDWIELYEDPNARSLTPEGDEDGDGRSNLEEYEIYGTHPSIPSTVYHVDSVLGSDDQEGLSWESPLQSIHAALSRAQAEDRIVLAAGLYEDDVTFAGNPITIQSRDPHDPNVVAGTVIAGTVSFSKGETRACRLEGVTIISPQMPAVLCENNSHPTLWKCVIRDMDGSLGMAAENESALVVCNNRGNLLMQDCQILNNQVPLLGVLFSQSSNVTLEHCLVAGNQGGMYTQALLAVSGELRLENCTVADNRATDDILPEIRAMVAELGIGLTQPAILLAEDATLQARNCILWNDPGLPEIDGWQLEGEDNSEAILSYCTLSQLPDPNTVIWQGNNLLIGEPYFARPGLWEMESPSGHLVWHMGDYHLQSQGARWDPQLAWVQDALTSPCIDAGDPETPLGSEPTPVSLERTDLSNTALNQGVYGGTPEASLRQADD